MLQDEVNGSDIQMAPGALVGGQVPVDPTTGYQSRRLGETSQRQWSHGGLVEMVAGGGQTLTRDSLQVVPLQAQLAVGPGEGDAHHACRAPPAMGSHLSETTMSPTPTVGMLSPVASSQLTPLPQALD